MQLAVFQRTTAADRFRRAIEMSDFARECAKAGLRARRPEFDERQIEDALLELLYGFRRPRE